MTAVHVAQMSWRACTAYGIHVMGVIVIDKEVRKVSRSYLIFRSQSPLVLPHFQEEAVRGVDDPYDKKSFNRSIFQTGRTSSLHFRRSNFSAVLRTRRSIYLQATRRQLGLSRVSSLSFEESVRKLMSKGRPP